MEDPFAKASSKQFLSQPRQSQDLASQETMMCFNSSQRTSGGSDHGQLGAKKEASSSNVWAAKE